MGPDEEGFFSRTFRGTGNQGSTEGSRSECVDIRTDRHFAESPVVDECGDPKRGVVVFLKSNRKARYSQMHRHQDEGTANEGTVDSPVVAQRELVFIVDSDT